MEIPRYWAQTDGDTTDPKGKRYRFQLWGWSQESASEALDMARRRLADLLSRIARGEPAGPYPYGRQPLREEIVRSLGERDGRGEAIVTRNRYGALVLNTARVPFIDVDVPTARGTSRLLGFFRRAPAVDPILEGIREACARHRRHGFRIYRTKAGYRVLATDLFLDPHADSTRDFLEEFDADPHFVRLCGLQGSFRARLTPKPWRCGRPLPPGRHPREDPDARSRFAAWLDGYESASDGFATCRFLEAVGSGRPSSRTRLIVEEHDRVTRAAEDLPLA